MRIRHYAIAAAMATALIATSAGCRSAVTPTDQKAAQSAPSLSPVAQASMKPAPPQSWMGTLYAFKADQSGRVDLYALRGTSRKLVASTPAGKDSCAFNSITVSPDGTKMAWVNTGHYSLDGDLFVGTIGGAPAKKIATHILCGGTGPRWAADSGSLWVGRRDAEPQEGWVDATSGAFHVALIQPMRVWSPSGAVQAYTDAEHHSITVAKADGTVLRTVGYRPTWVECEGWRTQTLSEDGRYLSVGYAACDPSRMLSVEKVVDTVTGKEISLPVKDIDRVYFRTDGGLVAIAGQTGYLIVDGKIVAQQKLASSGLVVVAYVA